MFIVVVILYRGHKGQECGKTEVREGKNAGDRDCIEKKDTEVVQGKMREVFFSYIL